MNYEMRITKVAVLPVGGDLFCTEATTIEIVDEAAGEFIEVTQSNDDAGEGTVRFAPEEWERVRYAMDYMMSAIAEHQIKEKE